MSEFEVPADDMADVIVLSVVRDDFLSRRLKKRCEHKHLEIDVLMTALTCRDCGVAIAPVEWIARNVEIWKRVRAQNDIARRNIDADQAKLADRKRCRCQHCGRMTGITREAKYRIGSEPVPVQDAT